MHTFWVFISTVTLVSLSLCTDAEDCENTTLKSGEADALLKLVNNFREKVRRGEQRNGFTGYNLPASESLSPLKWDCSFEAEAVKSMESYCTATKNKQSGWKSPPEAFTALGGSADVNAHQTIKLALSSVDFSDLKSVVNGSAKDGEVKYSDEAALSTFSFLIMEAATSMACARHKCNVNNQITTLAQCRLDVEKVQNGGVIYKAVEAPNACKSNAFMPDSVRKAFLSKHNNLRSLLAMGVVMNGNTGKMLGEAKKMSSLVYDCDLEKNAYERAKLCENFDHSGADNYWENRMSYTERLDRDMTKAAKTATQSWWSELSTSNGIDEFRNLYYANQNINSFAKIASDLTTKIGCAIYKCTNMVNVVCHYDTTLIHGDSLYESGTKCSGCPDTCFNGLCQASVTGANI